jgi:AcrR family transcriptional regulator
VFARQGVEAASLKDVAAEAQIAPGLLHHYFGRKEGLVMAVIERFGFSQEIKEILANAGDKPAAEVLTELAQGFAGRLADQAELMSIFFTGLANPQIREWLDIHVTEGRGVIAAFLQARVKQGELRKHDSPAAAQFLLAAVVIGQVTRAPTDPAVLVDMLLGGLANPAKPGQRGARKDRRR